MSDIVSTIGSYLSPLTPLASYALQAKGSYYQYSELLKDVERAINYEMKMRVLKDKLEQNRSKYSYICNLDQFFASFNEFSKFLDDLKVEGGVRNILKKNQMLLNETIDIAKAIQDDPEKIKEYEDRAKVIVESIGSTEKISKFEKIKNIWSRKTDLITSGFIYRWPEWYRSELNSVINRMNIAFDSVIFDMEMHRTKEEHAACPRKYQLKLDVAPPSEFDEEDAEEFFDALEDVE